MVQTDDFMVVLRCTVHCGRKVFRSIRGCDGGRLANAADRHWARFTFERDPGNKWLIVHKVRLAEFPRSRQFGRKVKEVDYEDCNSASPNNPEGPETSQSARAN
jgi:hypothetical protein